MIHIDNQVKTTSEIENHLAKTVLGNPGKLRYRHLHIRDRLRKVSNLRFVTLRFRKKLIGVVGIIDRTVQLNKDSVPVSYIRYLSVRTHFDGRAISRKRRTGKKKPSSLSEQVFSLFSSHDVESAYGHRVPALSYAYVEHENHASLNLSLRSGFHPIRTIKTQIFSRLFPECSTRVSEVCDSDSELFSHRITQSYCDANFFFISEDSHASRYVLSIHGTWVCGMRVIPAKWELIDLPRFTGWITKQVLSHTPYMNRLFNAQAFTFLAFDECWASPGYEHIFPELLEHVCATHKTYIALGWFDEHDPMYKHIQTNTRPGLLELVTWPVSANLIVHNSSLTEQEVRSLARKVAYVSAGDMI